MIFDLGLLFAAYGIFSAFVLGMVWFTLYISGAVD